MAETETQRIQHLESELRSGMTDEPDNLVLALLREIDGKLDRFLNAPYPKGDQTMSNRQSKFTNGEIAPLSARVYNLQEAAEQLRQPPRTVAKIAKRYGLCSSFRRDLYFSDSDIRAIWEIQRWHSSRPTSRMETRPSTFGARSRAKTSSELQALQSKPRRKKKGDQK